MLCGSSTCPSSYPTHLLSPPFPVADKNKHWWLVLSCGYQPASPEELLHRAGVLNQITWSDVLQGQTAFTIHSVVLDRLQTRLLAEIAQNSIFSVACGSLSPLSLITCRYLFTLQPISFEQAQPAPPSSICKFFIWLCLLVEPRLPCYVSPDICGHDHLQWLSFIVTWLGFRGNKDTVVCSNCDPGSAKTCWIIISERESCGLLPRRPSLLPTLDVTGRAAQCKQKLFSFLAVIKSGSYKKEVACPTVQ